MSRQLTLDNFILYSDEQLITVATGIIKGTCTEEDETASELYHRLFGDDNFTALSLGFAIVGELNFRRITRSNTTDLNSPVWQQWLTLSTDKIRKTPSVLYY